MNLNTIVRIRRWDSILLRAATIADHLWLMGRDGPIGQKIPGSRIVKEYSLIDRDLCWHPDIAKTSKFHDFVTEVKEEFKNL